MTTRTQDAEHFNAISKLAGTVHMKPRFHIHNYLADHTAMRCVRVCVYT
jgi:hypothetical protein